MLDPLCAHLDDAADSVVRQLLVGPAADCGLKERDVPVSVEICSASIAGLSKLCGLGSRFNGAVGGMFGLVGC